jgi:hypothetical protein
MENKRPKILVTGNLYVMGDIYKGISCDVIAGYDTKKNGPLRNASVFLGNMVVENIQELVFDLYVKGEVISFSDERDKEWKEFLELLNSES